MNSSKQMNRRFILFMETVGAEFFFEGLKMNIHTVNSSRKFDQLYLNTGSHKSCYYQSCNF